MTDENAFTSTSYYQIILLSGLTIVVGLFILNKIKNAQETFLEKVKCSSGALYGIQEMFNDTKAAADLLSELHKDMRNFTDQLVKKYCSNTYTNLLKSGHNSASQLMYFPNIEKSGLSNEDICQSVTRLKTRVNIIEVEEAPHEEGSSSYTIDKDKLMALCLREKPDTTKFHDYNTLWFVVAHELAHMMSVSEGHNEEFMKHFKFILYESVEQGLYHSVNYKATPITYCGVRVTNNPIYSGY
jgi:hypothetical protein